MRMRNSTALTGARVIACAGEGTLLDEADDRRVDSSWASVAPPSVGLGDCDAVCDPMGVGVGDEADEYDTGAGVGLGVGAGVGVGAE
mmetsp:Transcript_52516/g.154837  ORF Transcript_52516/g.154837 Transcript_52516/m.154837 type:complete len:87 (+) Transcript_52516:354-614(+)